MEGLKDKLAWQMFLDHRAAIRCDTKDEYDRLMRECKAAGLHFGYYPDPTKANYFDAGMTYDVYGDYIYYCSNIDCSSGKKPSAICSGPCLHRQSIPFSEVFGARTEKPIATSKYDGRGKHKVGDLFEVVLGGEFNPGDIVRLSCDDKSECPEFERVSDGKKYFYFWHKVKPIPAPTTRKIVITTDGRVTTARLIDGKRTIKTATATCSPSDEFSFETGARLAFDRLVLCKERGEIKTGLQLAIYHIEDALKAMK